MINGDMKTYGCERQIFLFVLLTCSGFRRFRIEKFRESGGVVIWL